MRRKPLGCLTTSGLITALLTALVVVLVGLLRGGVLFSPGLLNAQTGAPLGGATSHADLINQCSSCHTAFWQTASMADRCVLCHTGVAAQQQDPSTLHGNLLENNPGLTCRSCHPDHRGATASLTDMAMADVAHDAFGYSLNAHQQQADGSSFACKTCHVNSYTAFDQSVCKDCHQQIKASFLQPHLLAYGENCLSCHDGIDTYGHNFDHNFVAFKLTGKHIQVDCAGCHTGARSIADLQATPQDCFSCHAKNDVHNGQFGTACETCHSTNGWLPATFDHSLTQFPLTGAHIGLVCTQCHANNVFRGTPTDCYACHAQNDAHNGQFGTSCATCHSTDAWLPATFDHSLTQFALTGAHVGLACTQCHTNNVFTGLSMACAACHTDPLFHAGLFAGTSCSACHTTSAWLPASYDGPHPGGCEGNCIHHEGATCNDCHTTNLSTATCTKCHDSNNPGDGGGGD